HFGRGVDRPHGAVAEHRLDAVAGERRAGRQIGHCWMFASCPYAVKTAGADRSFLGQRMIGTVPPSALHAAPVTYEARSEQRKAITEAISSGSASRPSGRPAPTFASTSPRSPCWSARPPSPSHASVAVGPGVTALQRIPSFAYRSATRRENESNAAFITE